jgi:hypothetical protein
LIGGLLIGMLSMPAIYYSKRYQITIHCLRVAAVVIYVSLMVLFWRTFYQSDDPGKVDNRLILPAYVPETNINVRLFNSFVLFVDLCLACLWAVSVISH